MNYTTIKQSKKLLELGLNPESADMFYNEEPDENCPKYIVDTKYPMMIREGQKHYLKEYGTPCWSLGALWDINNICGIGPNNFGNKDVSSEHLFNTLYRWICIELIEDSDGVNSFLIEEGYIKKGAKDE